MASGDRQFQPLGNVPTPASWTLQGSLEIIPKSVNAIFDGTGAGGAFLPTLEIVSDSGVVIARVPTGSTVAAGDSAEVTWAPFLEATTASTPSGSVVGAWAGAALNMAFAPVTIGPQGSGTDVYLVDWTGADLEFSTPQPVTWSSGNPFEFFYSNLGQGIAVVGTFAARFNVILSGGIGAFDVTSPRLVVTSTDYMPTVSVSEMGSQGLRYVWGGGPPRVVQRLQYCEAFVCSIATPGGGAGIQFTVVNQSTTAADLHLVGVEMRLALTTSPTSVGSISPLA